MSAPPPDAEKSELLRLIPQVNELLELAERSAPALPRPVLLAAAHSVLDGLREGILSSGGELPTRDALSPEALAARVTAQAEAMLRPGFRKVINATGVVLHTNLGRAPLSRGALDAVDGASSGYCNLEFRLREGVRGSRQELLEPLLVGLTGAEAAMVVNNNAAAVLLALTALARGREVIVSRGQLVEIGDSFRLPDIMRQSGATLVEVGTTNITRLSDYRDAIGPDTALLMRVHQSNFRMVGYTEEAALAELVALGAQHALPVVEDLGSGSLVDLAVAGLSGEPTVRSSIEAGADLVTFSGDKLLGGPQAGIVVGGAAYVEALRRHPLARALRVDKLTIAALEATLQAYLDPASVSDRLPALRMLTEPAATVKRRAARLKRSLDSAGAGGLTCSVVPDVSRAGGGTLPAAEIDTFCLRVTHGSMTCEALEEALRRAEPPVLGRIREDALLLDLRTVSDSELPDLARIIADLV